MRPYLKRWQRVEGTDNVVLTIAYERNWWEKLTRVSARPRRYGGTKNVWRAYPSGYAVSPELHEWLTDLRERLESWRERQEAREERERNLPQPAYRQRSRIRQRSS